MFSRILAICALSLITAVSAQAHDSMMPHKKLHVYSSSKEHLIRPILKLFEKQEEVEVLLTTMDGPAMKTRLELEGADTQADAVVVADVANLYAMGEKGILLPLQSEVIEANIPAVLRADDNRWVGIAMRARLIYKRKSDKDIQINDYRDLADSKYKDSILIRSSQNEYNQSLLSDMIHRYGKDEATKWAKGVKDNMARPPSGGDRDQLRALASGEGKLAVGNSYYYALMLVSGDKSDREYAEMLEPIVPTGDEKYGPHVNIRGAGVVTHSKHKELAQKLVEFLTTEEAQHLLASNNYEYPANPAVKPAPILSVFKFSPDPKVPLKAIGAHNREAVEIFQQVGWQ